VFSSVKRLFGATYVPDLVPAWLSPIIHHTATQRIINVCRFAGDVCKSRDNK